MGMRAPAHRQKRQAPRGRSPGMRPTGRGHTSLACGSAASGCAPQQWCEAFLYPARPALPSAPPKQKRRGTPSGMPRRQKRSSGGRAGAALLRAAPDTFGDHMAAPRPDMARPALHLKAFIGRIVALMQAADAQLPAADRISRAAGVVQATSTKRGRVRRLLRTPSENSRGRRVSTPGMPCGQAKTDSRPVAHLRA